MINRIRAQVNSQLSRQGVSVGGGRATAGRGNVRAVAGGGQARAIAAALQDRGRGISISLPSKRDKHAHDRKGRLCQHKQMILSKLAAYGNRPDYRIRLDRINRFFEKYGIDDDECIVNVPVPRPRPVPYPQPYPYPVPQPIVLPIFGPVYPPWSPPPPPVPYYPPTYPTCGPGQHFDPYQRRCVPNFTPPGTPPVITDVAFGIATQAAQDVKKSLIHSDNFQEANVHHTRQYILQNFPGLLNNLVQIDLQNGNSMDRDLQTPSYCHLYSQLILGTLDVIPHIAQGYQVNPPMRTYWQQVGATCNFGGIPTISHAARAFL